MNEKLTLSKLVSIGALPKNSKLISDNLIKSTTISVSDFRNLESEKRIGLSNKIVIADSAEWVAMHKSGTFSCDSDGFIWQTSIGNKAITKKGLEGNSLIPLSQEILINPNEKTIERMEIKMENNKNGNVEVEDLLNSITNEEIAGEKKMEESNSFNPGTDNIDDAEKARKKAEKEEKDRKKEATIKEFRNTISNDVQGIQVGGLRDLGLFNQVSGRFFGYIMANAPKLNFGTKIEYIKSNGKKVLRDDVDDQKKKAWANKLSGQKIDTTFSPSDFKSNKVLNVTYSKPSNILGMIFSMPAGGFVPDDVIRSSGEGRVSFDSTKKDQVVLILPKDEAQTHISTYFNGKIAESEITHGENPGTLTVSNRIALTKDGQQVYKVVMKSSRGVFYTQNNWIARKINKTIRLEDAVKLDAAKLSDINRGCFGKLWKVPTAAGSVAPYYALSPVDKAKVSNENGVYTSELIKVGGKFPEITAYWDSEVKVNTIEIPMFEFKEKISEPGAYVTKAIQYDVLSPKEELEELNPENDKKFEKMRSILPADTTIKSAIAMVVSDSSQQNKSSSYVEMTPEQNYALITGIAQNTPSDKLTSKLTAERVRNYQDKIKTISFSV